MQHFPNLGLGYIQFTISLLNFSLLLFIVILFFKKKKYKFFTILLLSFIISIPGCMILDVTINKLLLRHIHYIYNEHMPKSIACMKYNPTYSGLDAEFSVLPEDLKKWTHKYKLKEEPVNTFSSKPAKNGQMLIAKYDPSSKVLIIKYSSF